MPPSMLMAGRYQRRYHYLCLRIMALSRAIGCTQRGVARSAKSLHIRVDRRPGASAVRLPASRTYLPALFGFRGRCPLGLPSILLKQKSGPKKRKFAKEVKRIEKEIVSDRIFGDRGTEDGKTKARGKSSSRLGKRLDFDKFIYFLFYASYI